MALRGLGTLTSRCVLFGMECEDLTERQPKQEDVGSTVRVSLCDDGDSQAQEVLERGDSEGRNRTTCSRSESEIELGVKAGESKVLYPSTEAQHPLEQRVHVEMTNTEASHYAASQVSTSQNIGKSVYFGLTPLRSQVAASHVPEPVKEHSKQTCERDNDIHCSHAPPTNVPAPESYVSSRDQRVPLATLVTETDGKAQQSSTLSKSHEYLVSGHDSKRGIQSHLVQGKQCMLMHPEGSTDKQVTSSDGMDNYADIQKQANSDSVEGQLEKEAFKQLDKADRGYQYIDKESHLVDWQCSETYAQSQQDNVVVDKYSDSGQLQSQLVCATDQSSGSERVDGPLQHCTGLTQGGSITGQECSETVYPVNEHYGDINQVRLQAGYATEQQCTRPGQGFFQQDGQSQCVVHQQYNNPSQGQQCSDLCEAGNYQYYGDPSQVQSKPGSSQLRSQPFSATEQQYLDPSDVQPQHGYAIEQQSQQYTSDLRWARCVAHQQYCDQGQVQPQVKYASESEFSNPDQSHSQVPNERYKHTDQPQSQVREASKWQYSSVSQPQARYAAEHQCSESRETEHSVHQPCSDPTEVQCPEEYEQHRGLTQIHCEVEYKQYRGSSQEQSQVTYAAYQQNGEQQDQVEYDQYSDPNQSQSMTRRAADQLCSELSQTTHQVIHNQTLYAASQQCPGHVHTQSQVEFRVDERYGMPSRSQEGHVASEHDSTAGEHYQCQFHASDVYPHDQPHSSPPQQHEGIHLRGCSSGQFDDNGGHTQRSVACFDASLQVSEIQSPSVYSEETYSGLQRAPDQEHGSRDVVQHPCAYAVCNGKGTGQHYGRECQDQQNHVYSNPEGYGRQYTPSASSAHGAQTFGLIEEYSASQHPKLHSVHQQSQSQSSYSQYVANASDNRCYDINQTSCDRGQTTPHQPLAETHCGNYTSQEPIKQFQYYSTYDPQLSEGSTPDHYSTQQEAPVEYTAYDQQYGDHYRHYQHSTASAMPFHVPSCRQDEFAYKQQFSFRESCLPRDNSVYTGSHSRTWKDRVGVAPLYKEGKESDKTYRLGRFCVTTSPSASPTFEMSSPADVSGTSSPCDGDYSDSPNDNLPSHCSSAESSSLPTSSFSSRLCDPRQAAPKINKEHYSKSHKYAGYTSNVVERRHAMLKQSSGKQSGPKKPRGPKLIQPHHVNISDDKEKLRRADKGTAMKGTSLANPLAGFKIPKTRSSGHSIPIRSTKPSTMPAKQFQQRAGMEFGKKSGIQPTTVSEVTATKVTTDKRRKVREHMLKGTAHLNLTRSKSSSMSSILATLDPRTLQALATTIQQTIACAVSVLSVSTYSL